MSGITRTSSLADVMSQANAGTLTLEDWLTFRRFGLGGVNNGTSDYVTLDRANALLAVLQRTEPTDPVTKYISDGIASGTMFRNDSKEIIKPSISVPNPVSGVTNFLSVLTQPQLWIRIAEFLIGGVLIAIGLASIAGTPNVISKVVKSKL